MRIHFSVISSLVTQYFTPRAQQAKLGASIEQNRKYKEEPMAPDFYSIGVEGNKAFSTIEANIYQPKTMWVKFGSDRGDTLL
jgi:hypothetical protein